MALACPRCGTQNPDGNQFCLACGNPLAAPPPAPAVPVGGAPASPFTQPPPAYVAPPAAGFAPPPPPPAYQTPFYSPQPGYAPAPVHRTPWLAIIGVVVALVVVMAGVGTVLAVGLSRSTGNQAANSVGELPSPSPAGSPSPIPTPSIQASTGTASSSNGTVTVPVPDGWSVQSTDADSVALLDPNSTGAIEVSSGSVSPPTTALQAKNEVDAGFKQQFPDTKPCAGSKTSNASIGGVTGIEWQLCFTVTSGAQAEPFGALLFVATNGAGTTGYGVEIIAPAGNLSAAVAESAPILKGIVWHLK